MQWNQYIKDLFVITASIQHTVDMDVWTKLATTAANVRVIVAKQKKSPTAYESP